jgi:acyl-CoA synthetase (AMP-forming)/AMP-acid ligase II
MATLNPTPLSPGSRDTLRRHPVSVDDMCPAQRERSGAIRSLLEEASRVMGGRVAFVDAEGGGEVTWADVSASAALWEERFVLPEVRDARSTARSAGGDVGRPVVGLRIAAPEVFCREFLGALAAGVCVVPIDPRCTQGELDRYAASFRLTHLLSDGAEVLDLDAARQLRSGRFPRPRGSTGDHPSRSEVDSILTFGGLADSLDLLAEPAAVLERTSGSSGRPKLVPLTERQLIAAAAAAVEHQRLSGTDRGFSALPLFDVESQVVGILATLVSGGSLAVQETFEPDNFWERVEATGATWLSLSPAMIARLTEVPSDQVRRQVRFARSGSEALPRATHSRFWLLTGISVLETYTLTEAAGQVAANPLRVGRRRPGSVGLPVHTRVRVVDDGGNVVVSGQIGHVEIEGVGVITSYLPEGRLGPLIEACDSDGWLGTGDVGWLDDAGYLFLAGQIDDVIEQADAKLYPREIEDVLVSVLGVVEAAVVGRPAPTGAELPVAFIGTGSRLEPQLAQSLRQRIENACAAKLAQAKRPFEIVVSESLPFGPTGKVARHELRKVLHSRLTGAA